MTNTIDFSPVPPESNVLEYKRQIPNEHIKFLKTAVAFANAFHYMHLIEQWGAGIPRIVNLLKESGLGEPEFIDMEIAVRINIYRKTDDKPVIKQKTDDKPTIKQKTDDKKRCKNAYP